MLVLIGMDFVQDLISIFFKAWDNGVDSAPEYLYKKIKTPTFDRGLSPY